MDSKQLKHPKAHAIYVELSPGEAKDIALALGFEAAHLKVNDQGMMTLKLMHQESTIVLFPTFESKPRTFSLWDLVQAYARAIAKAYTKSGFMTAIETLIAKRKEI